MFTCRLNLYIYIYINTTLRLEGIIRVINIVIYRCPGNLLSAFVQLIIDGQKAKLMNVSVVCCLVIIKLHTTNTHIYYAYTDIIINNL